MIEKMMGVPRVEGDALVVPIADAAFICTRCGNEKEDKTSTYCFKGDEVLCDVCYPEGYRRFKNLDVPQKGE